ncbi:MAG: zinc-dependent alcohol dehydrogenase [Chloroflexota bacterium]
MKAAVLQAPYRITVEEMPEPEPKPQEVKIRVVAAGICGSEVHAYRGTHPWRHPPSILGHEMTGQVVAVGVEVRRIQVGDRVTVEPQVVCGVCGQCSAGFPNLCTDKTFLGTKKWIGAYAEFIVSPERCVYPLPEQVSYAEGVMVEPLAVGVHAVRESGLGPGGSALILGAGTIGLGALASAVEAGATTIIATDVADFNLAVARELGATATVNIRHQDVLRVVSDLTDGKGVDVALVAAGVPEVVNQAISAVRPRGRVLLIAIFDQPIKIDDAYAITCGERVLRGSQTYCPQDMQKALDLIASGRVDAGKFITHRLPMRQLQRGFDIADKRLEDCIKVVLEY